jgi:ribosomal protein S18 acetylase RimI-like enzyme
VFELSRDVIGDVIFAMEDQDGAWSVDLGNGSLISRDQACGDGEVDASTLPESIAIPEWTPRDGFKLMESFAADVRLPSVRKTLHDALGRGRGVFKAFKECLTEYPDLEKAFREKKAAIMGLRIREWYDDIRVTNGLERLGEAPEDSSDLIQGDLGFSSGLASVARPRMTALFARLLDEIAGELPQALVDFETRRITRMFESEEWVGLWVEDGEGGAIAGAAGRSEVVLGFGLARIFFLAVDMDFRRQGIARALVDRLSAELGGDEGGIILLDSGLLLPDFDKGLASTGFSTFGVRAWRRI